MKTSTTRQLLAAGLTLAALTTMAVACSDETIVLASLPPDDDDAGLGVHEKIVCYKQEDCDDGNEFCMIEQGSSKGICRHRPVFCGGKDFEPVCGSNGITYANDCYRKSAGISSATDGECPNERALRCDAQAFRCPIGATCELLGGGFPGSDVCGPPGGHCWGIVDPHDCDSDDVTFGKRYNECSTDPLALRCVNACKAILSGHAFAEAFDCSKTPADAGAKP